MHPSDEYFATKGVEEKWLFITGQARGSFVYQRKHHFKEVKRASGVKPGW